MADKNIYVTMPTLAPLDDVTELLKGVWERGIMTHNGPLVQRFERGCPKRVPSFFCKSPNFRKLGLFY